MSKRRMLNQDYYKLDAKSMRKTTYLSPGKNLKLTRTLRKK